MELGEAITDDVMVLAFLRAEVNSELYGRAVLASASAHGCDRRVIDWGSPWDVRENRFRRQILGDVRGYGRDAMLFRSFPSDARWHRARLSIGELARARYAA
jgi:hypothetical protein